MKKNIGILASAFLLTIGSSFFAPQESYAAGAKLESNSGTIYAYDYYHSGQWLDVPYDMSVFQIRVSNANSVSYEVIKGNSATVSRYGLVEPRYVTYYKYGDYWTTEYLSNQSYTDMVDRYVYGDTVIRVTADGASYDVTVKVADYAEVYADSVIDDYVKRYYSGSMSDYDAIDLAASFVVDYRYSEFHSTAAGMIASGDGDCRAASQAIVKILEKTGLSGWLRDDGDGHTNVMAQDKSGNYYVIDTGHNYWEAREYMITQVSTPFSYNILDDETIEVTSYDGKEVPENLYIPNEIDGHIVTAIGDSFIKGSKTVKNVNIPDTVTSIGQSAFNSCTALKTINIPASVKEIGTYAFTGCSALESFNCASNSEYFSASKSVLYNADKTVLYFAPSIAELTVPATVKEVADYAAYQNSKLTTVVVNSSVETIGEGAFGSCNKLNAVTIYGIGLKKIGPYAFAMDLALKNLFIPASVNTLGEKLLYKYTGLTEIRFGGSDSQWKNIAANNDFSCINVIKNTLPYTDVDLGKYYGEGVKALYNSGIMTGLTATTFGPSEEMSRAMVVTVLYRYEGSPAVETNGSPFPDIPNDKSRWYFNSIAWAKETGVVNGYNDGTFGKDNSILRQDFIKMLYSYAESKGLDVSVKSATSYQAVADHKTVSMYARPYVNWGYEKQLIGKGSPLDPKGKLTRAQAATILDRFIKLYS